MKAPPCAPMQGPAMLVPSRCPAPRTTTPSRVSHAVLAPVMRGSVVVLPMDTAWGGARMSSSCTSLSVAARDGTQPAAPGNSTHTSAATMVQTIDGVGREGNNVEAPVSTKPGRRTTMGSWACACSPPAAASSPCCKRVSNAPASPAHAASFSTVDPLFEAREHTKAMVPRDTTSPGHAASMDRCTSSVKQ